MKNRIKRLTALLLAMTMCLSLLSVSVWAADAEPQEDASIATQGGEEATPEDEATAVEESAPDETESAPEAEIEEPAEEPEEKADEETSLSESEESKEKAPVDSGKTEEDNELEAQSTGGHTQAEAVAWAEGKANAGQTVGTGQCVALINAYYEYLGNSWVYGNATDYQSNALPGGWQRITNYQGFAPQAGDIAVWAAYSKLNQSYTLDQNGHIGIVRSGDSSTFNSVEQNVNGLYPQYCNNRPTNLVACWIRPDFSTTPIYDSKPKYATVTLNQRTYQVGESVEFVMSSDTATCYTIGIDDANGNRIDTHDTGTKESSYIRSFATPGQYSCYITAYNDLGLTDSERVYFLVYDSKPKYATVTLNQRTYQVGESVEFVMSSDTATCYTIGIDDANGNRIDTHDTGTKQSNYIRSFATPGQYSCYITAYNNLGLIDSERIYFTVYDTKPKTAAVTLAKTTYQVGESVEFVMSSDTATCYTIGIDDANGKRIDTHDTGTKESNYIKSFATPGQYSCYITAYNNLGLIDSERIYFYVKTESVSVCKTHTWDNGIVTTPATCVSQGTKTYTCTVCGKTRTEAIEKLPEPGPEPEPEKEENTISGKDAFTKTVNVQKNQTFSLGAKTKGGAKLSYKSSNKKVTVKNGKVTVKKGFMGQVTITVTASETAKYKKAQKKITLMVGPSASKLSSVKWDKKKKVVNVSWKKNTTGKGYEVQYSTDKKLKKSVKMVIIGKNSTLKTTIKGLKKGTWYFRVRTVNGKLSSRWSKVKTLKITK